MNFILQYLNPVRRFMFILLRISILSYAKLVSCHYVSANVSQAMNKSKILFYSLLLVMLRQMFCSKTRISFTIMQDVYKKNIVRMIFDCVHSFLLWTVKYLCKILCKKWWFKTQQQMLLGSENTILISKAVDLTCHSTCKYGNSVQKSWTKQSGGTFVVRWT